MVDTQHGTILSTDRTMKGGVGDPPAARQRRVVICPAAMTYTTGLYGRIRTVRAVPIAQTSSEPNPTVMLMRVWDDMVGKA
jgi:hypothetical protein